MQSVDVRDHLVRALAADLIGPFSADGSETLDLPPSRWYLTGFLAPEDGRVVADPTVDEDEGTWTRSAWRTGRRQALR